MSVLLRIPDPKRPGQEIRNPMVPNCIVAGIEQIDFSFFASSGRDLVIVDLDNTIASGFGFKTDEKAIEALRAAKKDGYIQEMCLLSNIQVAWPPFIRRVQYFAGRLQTPYWHAAIWPISKPSGHAVATCLGRMIFKNNNFFPLMPDTVKMLLDHYADRAVVIGDQLKNDALCGNRAGCTTIVRYPAFGETPGYNQKKRAREVAMIESFKDQLMVPGSYTDAYLKEEYRRKG